MGRVLNKFSWPSVEKCICWWDIGTPHQKNKYDIRSIWKSQRRAPKKHRDWYGWNPKYKRWKPGNLGTCKDARRKVIEIGLGEILSTSMAFHLVTNRMHHGHSRCIMSTHHEPAWCIMSIHDASWGLMMRLGVRVASLLAARLPQASLLAFWDDDGCSCFMPAIKK